MFNRKAISKLKAILIIDILVVAVAAGTYIYFTNQGIITEGPRPAEFTSTGLSIDPLEAEAGEPITISFNLTNVGETEGNYTAILAINNATRENQTLTLTPSESSLVTFTDVEKAEGNYSVQIGELTGSFLIKPAPPINSAIVLSKLTVTPYEGWVDEPITITVTATNPSSSADSLPVKLTITQKSATTTFTETQRIELQPRQNMPVSFTYNATSEGTFTVKMGSLVSAFIIVPTGSTTSLWFRLQDKRLTLRSMASVSRLLTRNFFPLEYLTPSRSLQQIQVEDSFS